MDLALILFVIIAALAGAGLGWLLGARQAALYRKERDDRLDDFRKAITDLADVQTKLDEARDACSDAKTECARLSAGQEERERAFEARLKEVRDAREEMSAKFSEIGAKLLGEAQKSFLERAEARFKQSEEVAGQGLKALLQPVTDRLQRYEEGVAKVEAERRDAFGNLVGLIESMRIGQEKVSTEAAKLVNSLRNAPKSRGRWGEQQLKNVLETCGLSENCDFQTEVSVEGEDGRLRPDVVIRIPGGRTLIVDAKVSLNAYQDAFGAVDDAERRLGLANHAAAMRAHVNALGNKAYQTQFGSSPDYVIMFVPGEHFLSAALEHDPTLWDFAFDKKVLLATPTNLIAIARSVASVWQQEALARNARDIAVLGKELYDRLAKVGEDLRKVGTGLNSAVSNFNNFTSSFNSRLVSTGRKFRDLNIETGARELEDVPAVELLASAGEVPLRAIGDDTAEAAE
jgi:DNA recombination protein RmuC